MTRKSFYQRVPPSPPSPGILQSKEGPCTSGLICRIVIFTIIFVRIVIHTWEETQGGFWVVFARLARFADWAILPSWTPPPPPPPPGSCPLGQRRKWIFRWLWEEKKLIMGFFERHLTVWLDMWTVWTFSFLLSLMKKVQQKIQCHDGDDDVPPDHH